MSSGLTDVKSLATAQDRGHACVKSLACLLSNQLIGFVVVLTTFRVADNHVRATQLSQHLRGDFTGERTVVVDRNILCAVLNLKLVSVNDGLNGAKIREGRDHQDLAA